MRFAQHVVPDSYSIVSGRAPDYPGRPCHRREGSMGFGMSAVRLADVARIDYVDDDGDDDCDGDDDAVMMVMLMTTFKSEVGLSTSVPWQGRARGATL